MATRFCSLTEFSKALINHQMLYEVHYTSIVLQMIFLTYHEFLQLDTPNCLARIQQMHMRRQVAWSDMHTSLIKKKKNFSC